MKRTAVVAGLQDSVKPQKKAPLEWFNGCTCACPSPQVCVPLVKEFAELGDTQGGFWSVPAKVKPLHERAGKHRTPKVVLEIQKNAALRAAWSNHIHLHSGRWESKDYISRVHFHPSVVALAKTTKGGRLNMPSVVPKQTAAWIGNYTNADKIPGCENGDYFPVPNCPLEIAAARLHQMQAVTSTLHASPMSTSSIAVAALSSPVMLPPYISQTCVGLLS
jgi:hypothetical protein